jgi:nicotinamidase-related amidase
MSEHEQVTGMLSAKNAAPLELDPSCTALIVVDMQRYFTQPSFPFTDLFEKMSPGVCSGYLRRVRENVIPSIRRLLDHFRKNGSLVVFTAVHSSRLWLGAGNHRGNRHDTKARAVTDRPYSWGFATVGALLSAHNPTARR